MRTYTEQEKRCPRCEETKPLDEFNIDKRSRTGRTNWCKPCKSAYDRQYLSDPVIKETRRQRTAIWTRRNKERARIAKTRVRARHAGVINTLIVDEWYDILSRYDHRCAYCQDPFECIDHLIPLSKGGPNSAENVVPACQICNWEKGRHPAVIRNERPFILYGATSA